MADFVPRSTACAVRPASIPRAGRVVTRDGIARRADSGTDRARSVRARAVREHLRSRGAKCAGPSTRSHRRGLCLILFAACSMLAIRWAPTRSFAVWARGRWARSIRPGTVTWAATPRSRSCAPSSPKRPTSSRGSSRRRARPRPCATPASSRSSTAICTAAGARSSSWSTSPARIWRGASRSSDRSRRTGRPFVRSGGSSRARSPRRTPSGSSTAISSRGTSSSSGRTPRGRRRPRRSSTSASRSCCSGTAARTRRRRPGTSWARRFICRPSKRVARRRSIIARTSTRLGACCSR